MGLWHVLADNECRRTKLIKKLKGVVLIGNIKISSKSQMVHKKILPLPKVNSLCANAN